MKIYTKKGDKGQTSLIGGTRVSKDDIKIEAYGTVDELNAYIGLVRDGLTEKHPQFSNLVQIQNDLFVLGSLLAEDKKKSKMKLPSISENSITLMEIAMDNMDSELPPMKHFVLPGGHINISNCHIARCICRRAERRCITLSKNEDVDNVIIAYLNRLSDYLFMISRYVAHQMNITEIKWLP